MKIKSFFLALSLLPLLAHADQPALAPSSFKDTARLIRPSVVNISTVKNVKMGGALGMGGPTGDPFFDRFFGGQGAPQGAPSFKSRSLGSGVIIDAAAGYIVTNNHVVEGADSITVKLPDKRELEAEIVGRDPKTDLAVLRVKQDAKGGALKAASFGDSDAIEVGDWVLAIGSPFGLEQTVSHGIISAKGRVIGQGPYEDFLQTDAPINPGNSGGPLVNLAGEVVGINSAITSNSGGSEGIGFAIPSSLVKKISAQLIKSGKVTRGWLGISIQELEGPLAKYFGLPEDAKGVLVADVMDDGPAKKAGLRDGDVILDFAGKKAESVRELQGLVADSAVGQGISVKIWRDKAVKTLSISPGNMSESDGEDAKAAPETQKGRLGLRVRDLSPDEAAQARAGAKVLVEEVEQGSPADEAGIQAGDLILELDRSPIRSAEDFSRLARKVPAGQSVVVQVSREGHSLYRTLKLP